MSVSTVKIIMNRIKQAPAASKIAVFRWPEPDLLDGVFDSTFRTRMRIRAGDPDYIGSFWKKDGPGEVESMLEREARRDA